jgi:hypothetical protein
MKKKITYPIRNWSEYNASLKQRGSLTIWVSSEAVEKWTTDELTGERGASQTYTDLAIETMATIQAIYRLAGRQTQGFLQSVFELMKLNLTVPDHSTPSQVSADGAYDQRKCYDTLNKHGAKAAIPPRKGAKIWQHANSHVRDENLRRIRQFGRKEWK